MKTWFNPEVGEFRFIDYAWVGECTFTSFKAFRYKDKGRNIGKSKVKARFATESEGVLPSKTGVTVLKRIIKNNSSLALKLQKALLADLNGNGPHSGMWWHGDILCIQREISEATGPLRKMKLDSSTSIASLLGDPSISIWDQYDYEPLYKKAKSIASIKFKSFIDPGHGVGFLTDGVKILGVGYADSVGPYKTS